MFCTALYISNKIDFLPLQYGTHVPPLLVEFSIDQRQHFRFYHFYRFEIMMRIVKVTHVVMVFLFIPVVVLLDNTRVHFLVYTEN